MLKIEPTNHKELLDELNSGIFGENFDGKVGFILYYQDIPIGVAKIKADEKQSKFMSIGIKKEYRGRGFGDFFTRSLMNTLSYISKEIVVEYQDDYFLKFGFYQKGNKMLLPNAKNIVFPSKCRGEG